MFGAVGGAGDASDAQHQNLEGGVSFKFNFAVDDDGSKSDEGKVEEEEDKEEKHHRHRLGGDEASTMRVTAPAFEVFPKSFDVAELQLDAVDVGLASGPLLKVRPPLTPSSSSITAHSDLVPGVYEGGFKLWEGAIDLCRLLVSSTATTTAATTTKEEDEDDADDDKERGRDRTGKFASLSFVPLDKHSPRWLPGSSAEAPRSFFRSLFESEAAKTIRFLELGCGSALPSLVAAKMVTTEKKNRPPSSSASPLSVTLCDFNAEVLESCTAANVAANFSDEENDVSFRYFAGDWSNLPAAISSSSSSSSSNDEKEHPGFDLVLAAEVTYNPSSYAALAEAVAALLRPPPAEAAALVAAKRHYFGVGGNVEGFIETVKKLGKLRVQRVAEVVDGPLARDVLMLTRIR